MAPGTSDTTFAEATSIKQLSSHTYEAVLRPDWCIGSVPHGGYVTSCFQAVTALHFKTTLASQNQPHTISLHLEFLRRTEIGPALFTVKDSKVGRQTSVIQVTLSQGPTNSREEVVGYITNSNTEKEEGITLPTGFVLHPPAPIVDLSKLRENKDPNWARFVNIMFPEFRKATKKLQTGLPRAGQPSKSIADEWVTFTSGERFTDESLGYVCDSFQQVVEAWRDGSPLDVDGKPIVRGSMWYPTLNLSLNVKKNLPKEGVEWLFVRVAAKQIKNGRMDLNITILDADGDIVALSHHTALVVDAGRNVSKRSHDSSKI